MTVAFLVIIVVAGVLGTSAVVALAWAVTSGEMSDFGSGATSIFDADEPIGTQTDFFPGEEPEQSNRRRTQ